MKKIIIYEGIDCLGKSTEALVRAAELEKLGESSNIIHMTGQDDNSPKGIIELISKHNTDNLIFDRSFIGEMVYGPRYRDTSDISTYGVGHLLNDYSNDNEVYLYVTTDIENYNKAQHIRAKETGQRLDNTTAMMQDQMAFIDVMIDLCRYMHIVLKVLNVEYFFNNGKIIDRKVKPISIYKAKKLTYDILMRLGGLNEN